MEIILIIVIAVSLFFNAFLFYRLRKKPKKTQTYDAKQLLSDLTRGAGLVEIRVIDPESIFMRSPRDLN